MKHRIPDTYVKKRQKIIRIIAVVFIVLIGLLFYFATGSYWSAITVLFYKVIIQYVGFLLGYFEEHYDDKQKWEIEKKPDGFRFHYKNTGATVLFSDIMNVIVNRKNGNYREIILFMNNKQRIGIDGYNEMESIYNHLKNNLDPTIINFND